MIWWYIYWFLVIQSYIWLQKKFFKKIYDILLLSLFKNLSFDNFTNWYTMSEFFYDIHPPLGKLVMFLFANLSEYDGSIEFSRYYAQSFHNYQYIILRITPAFFSSLRVPLIYLTLRFDSFSSCAAFISSFMIICDTSLLTDQRFILSAGMLHWE